MENVINVKPCEKCSNFSNIDLSRIKTKLDILFDKKNFDEAKRLIKYWIQEAQMVNDKKSELELKNEYMGLLRKLNEIEAITIANSSYELIYELKIENTISAGTIFINIGTVYKAFNRAKDAEKYFLLADTIYNKCLKKDDILFAGLYNNMALMYVDINEFDKANKLYNDAINILKENNNQLDLAITYLNLLDLYYKKNNIEKVDNIDLMIDEYIKKSFLCLTDKNLCNNEYFRFVIEKCIPSFSFYGYFLYENELKKYLSN